jgi:outer membrane protein OmpA-like peptidoglycan-associated protein
MQPSETGIIPEPSEAETKPPTVEEPADSKKIPEESPEKPASIKFIIRPVFFDFDSYALTEPSKLKIDELISALKEYPFLKLEIMGYTDSKGSFEYNQALSEKRANAVSDYLIKGGIEKSRLTVSGFSESGNIAVNEFPDGHDSVEGRKLNRRVEFRIIEMGKAMLKMEKPEIPEYLRVN